MVSVSDGSRIARQVGDKRLHYLVNSGRFYEKDKALKICLQVHGPGSSGRAKVGGEREKEDRCKHFALLLTNLPTLT